MSKYTRIKSAAASLSVLGSAIVAICPESAIAAERRTPNVVYIVADDLGWGDVQALGGKVPTPNMDRLVSQGMTFADAHTPGATCHPTRFGLITGSNAYRNGVRYGASQGFGDALNLPRDRRHSTTGDVVHSLRDESGNPVYATGFMGKMHLGAPALANYGFDYVYGFPTGMQTAVNKIIDANGNLITDNNNTPFSDGLFGWTEEEIAPLGGMMASRARQFIEDNSDRPFYLQYQSLAAHAPQRPPQFFENYDGTLSPVKGSADVYGVPMSQYGAMIKEFDLQVGMILDTLEAEGVADNTLVIVTSDNGGMTNLPDIQRTMPPGHDSAGYIPDAEGVLHHIRGTKGTMWEGGSRVPFIAKWGDGTSAGSYVAPGTINQQLVSTNDMAATLHDLLGQSMVANQAMDSASLLPTLFDRDQAIRDSMYLQAGGDTDDLDIEGLEAAWRMDDPQGEWVLLFRSDEPLALKDGLPELFRASELYNLSDDLSQANDLLLNDVQIDANEQPSAADLMLISDSTMRDRVAGMINAFFSHWMKNDARTTPTVDYANELNQTPIPDLQILAGDTNGDGLIDLKDLNNIRNNFGQHGNGILGDTQPFDGRVDLFDLNAVRNHFGNSSNPVPEPTTGHLGALFVSAMVAIKFAFRRAWGGAKSKARD